MKCSWCGKEFTVLYPDLWAYKVGKKWFCTWKCLRADEKKGEDEMPRMKKDGTPAKKPGRKKPEVYKIPTERTAICEGQGQKEGFERFVPIEQVKQINEGEKAMTTEELEVAAAALINEDIPMTAEERAEKWPIIPTRVETKNGTWEIVDGYKGFDTLVGFRSKSVHEFGPLSDRGYVLVLTVSEWDALHDEMDQAMNMMKL